MDIVFTAIKVLKKKHSISDRLGILLLFVVTQKSGGKRAHETPKRPFLDGHRPGTGSILSFFD